MCTAISYLTRDHYFGRTLDLEYGYRETVTVTPRNFTLPLRTLPSMDRHYAIIGMATVVQGYPLYYEACNEWGLAMAGLNFPGNARYFPRAEGKDNIASFEFIPWILGQCRDLAQAREKLETIQLCDIPFSDALPPSPLHWIIAHRSGCLTVESTADGLKIYDNPIGVLTNNPPFDYHMTHLCQFMNLTRLEPENRFADVKLEPYSKGMGAIGLPGDLSSPSRFVRAAFVKLNSRSDPEEGPSVSQFFHILGAVAQQRGCVRLKDGRYEITRYTSCMNTDKGIYYYTTYENQRINAVDLHRCELESTDLFCFPLAQEPDIRRQN